MATRVFAASRRDLLASSRRRLVRSLAIASAMACLLFAVVFVLAPFRNHPVIRVVLPPTRTVILKELVPEPPAGSRETLKPDLEQLQVQKVQDPPSTETIPEPTPPPLPAVRREPPRALDRVAERTGRERAREATADLANATATLDKALGELSSSLRGATAGTYQPSRRARLRSVGPGRSDGQLAAVGNGLAGSGTSTDLRGSKVTGSLVAIGTLAPARLAESPATEGGTASGSRPGVYRSNASLLAVIQKYAAGIQYCYESELKRDSGLRGKLVVALTVAPAGKVLEAAVVQNTVGSERLASCALSQIRSWRFPPIAGGLTTFQAPFVFTPPN